MLKRSFFALALSTACLAGPPAYADAREDAEFIVAQSSTNEMVDGMLTAFAPMITGAMDNEMRKKGIILSDPDTFFRIVMEAFDERLIANLRDAMVGLYLEEFSAEDLAAIAAFLRTPAGVRMLEKTPQLSQRGGEMGRIIGQKAAQEMAGQLAKRAREEGLTFTVDPAKRDELLNLLDQMSDGT